MKIMPDYIKQERLRIGVRKLPSLNYGSRGIIYLIAIKILLDGFLINSPEMIK